MRKIIIAALIGVVILIASFIIIASTQGEDNLSNEQKYPLTSRFKGLTPHDPIHIYGNANFTAANGIVSGSGTIADPYIIENWDINASTADGIYIESTDVYFIIRNCVVHDGRGNYDGISFFFVQNGKIDNVTFYNNHFGIYPTHSSNNQITNCYVYNNGYGFWLDHSSNNVIANCRVYNHSSGIYLYYDSHNIAITNCNFYDSYCGIELLSSDNCQITNCNLYNNYYGIDSFGGDSANITNCNVYNNSYGIYLLSSSNSNITSCHVYNNSEGIWLVGSPNSKLRNNILEHNKYNFGVWGHYLEIEPYYQDIDTSNKINGKPIYYVIEQSNSVFDETMSIGYLGLVSCVNITVKNLTLTNNIDGLLLANTSHSTITNCYFSKTGKCSICVGHSSNNTITNCNLHDIGDIGICLWQSSNNSITNCYVYNIYITRGVNPTYGMALYYSSNNNIKNCYVYNNTWTVTSDSYGIYLYHSDNNTITNCNLHDNDYGICLGGSSNNNITNCYVYNETDDGVCLSYSPNNNITNCDLYNSSFGIELDEHSNNNQITNCNLYNNSNGIGLDYYSNNNQITNCNFYNNGICILLDYYSNNNQITGCHIYNNYGGIWLRQLTSNNNLSANYIYNNSYYYFRGIYLDGSSNNKLRNNILDNNTYNFGVCGSKIEHYYQDIDTSNKINGKPIYYLVEKSDLVFDETYNIGYLGLVCCRNITVRNLEFKNNTQGILLANTSHSNLSANYVYNNSYGIHLDYSSNNTLSANYVYNNYYHYYGYGIYLYYSSDNLIYNNYFNNTNNAYSWGGTGNRWNITKTLGTNIINGSYLGGNYWSDYTGTDVDGDGLGDTPYTIPGGSGEKDYLPLVKAPVAPPNQPPTITITYLLENQTVNGTITITGTASDIDGTVEKVEIKIDYSDWQLAAGTTTWSFIWDTIAVPNGLHTIYARAYDGLNYSDIKTVNVYVNNPMIVRFIPTPITGANITAGYTGLGLPNVSVEVAPPPHPNLIGLGIYINITAPETIALSWLYIEIPYDENLLPNGIKEEDLKLYYWNETSGKWECCDKIGTTGVDTVRNIVWANVTHLTIFAPMAEKIVEAPPVSWLLYIGIIAIVIIIVIAVVIARVRKKK